MNGLLRRNRMAWLAGFLVVCTTVVGCASDPTASAEYQDLAAEYQDLEAQLTARDAELSANEEALSDATGQVAELEAQMSVLEAEHTEATEDLAAIESEMMVLSEDLTDWKDFAGSPHDEPFSWSQEFFEAFVLTCSSDPASPEPACMCFAEGLEAQISLLDLLLLGELTAASEFGLVETDDFGIPVGMPSDMVGLMTALAFECFSEDPGA